jgi:hypothetical protein
MVRSRALSPFPFQGAALKWIVPRVETGLRAVAPSEVLHPNPFLAPVLSLETTHFGIYCHHLADRPRRRPSFWIFSDQKTHRWPPHGQRSRRLIAPSKRAITRKTRPGMAGGTKTAKHYLNHATHTLVDYGRICCRSDC